jgi:hypothetical protein
VQGDSRYLKVALTDISGIVGATSAGKRYHGAVGDNREQLSLAVVASAMAEALAQAEVWRVCIIRM